MFKVRISLIPTSFHHGDVGYLELKVHCPISLFHVISAPSRPSPTAVIEEVQLATGRLCEQQRQ